MPRIACLVVSWICTSTAVFGLAPATGAQVIEPGGGAPEQVESAEREAALGPASVETFSGRLLRAEQDRLSFVVPEEAEPKVVRLAPELIARLGDIAGRSFEITAVERGLPSGIVSAISLEDPRGLYAIAESIRDQPLLTPQARAGIRVEQLTSEKRTRVYETDCEVVYNVPTAFFVGAERYVLQPAEAREIEIEGTGYLLTLDESRFVVPKVCPAVFEGAQRRIDYSLVRR